MPWLRFARRTVFAAWFLLLLFPAASMFSAAGNWDAEPLQLLATSAGLFVLLWLLAGSRWFPLLTWPLAFAGVMAVGADVLRGANLAELVLVSAGDAEEVRHALAPYVVPMVVTGLGLAAVVAAALRWPSAVLPPRVRAVGAVGLAIGLAAAAAVRPVTVLRAWPLNVASVKAAAWIGRPDFIATALPTAPINPRSPDATWSASRAGGETHRETVVIVVGESVRADRLADCGGHPAVDTRHEVVVYCDVTSGSSSTHTSVPLLLSREMPGAAFRVSRDATALQAFEEVGFRSYWLGMQGPTVAWPDADVERYVEMGPPARKSLLPMLRWALAQPEPRKVIVLHTYDAHYPYCDRYDAREAPLAVDCRRLGLEPTVPKRPLWLMAYDNAVVESMRFLDAVMDELEASGGEAFLAYTSDHGENLLDDERLLFNHSLSQLTRYDTRVPMIFWDNAAWRRSHPAESQRLAANRGLPAMHADLVPTVLGAHGIHYDEPRKDVTNLADRAPPPRVRWVSPRLGQAVDGDRLR